jgi:hypothetical protein
MCKNLNLDQGDVYKSKYNLADRNLADQIFQIEFSP